MYTPAALAEIAVARISNELTALIEHARQQAYDTGYVDATSVPCAKCGAAKEFGKQGDLRRLPDRVG